MSWINDMTGQTDYGNYQDEQSAARLKEIQKQSDASKQKNLNAINSLTGEAGYNKALQTARQTAADTAQNATASAQNASIQAALQQGLSKAMAGMNAGNQAANTYAQTYGNKLSEEQNRMQQYQQAELETQMEQIRQEAEKQKREYQAKLAEKQRNIERAMMIGQAALKYGGYGMRAFANSDTWKNFQNDRMLEKKYGAGQGWQGDYDASLTNGNTALAKWTTGMGMTSDIKAKKPAKVEDVNKLVKNPKNVEDLLKNIESIAYKYTDEAQDKLGVDDDVHVGTTAQSVEKSNPEIVSEKQGYKQLNMQELLESTLAGIAVLYKKMERSEDQNKEKEE